jgi:hypothetical protein
MKAAMFTFPLLPVLQPLPNLNSTQLLLGLFANLLGLELPSNAKK